ncbi:hypothetical protein GEMRC1_013571 [Eukaryota sp. GEM-RC1]
MVEGMGKGLPNAHIEVNYGDQHNRGLPQAHNQEEHHLPHSNSGGLGGGLSMDLGNMEVSGNAHYETHSTKTVNGQVVEDTHYSTDL